MALRGFTPPIARRIARRAGGLSSSIVQEWTRPSPGRTGSPLRMFRTPAGGIPAATSSVAGSAVCTEFPDGIGGNPGGTATVFNHRTNVIPQNVFVLVQMFRTTFGQERLFVIESNCPAGIVNPNPNPEPPIDDQGGGGDLPP